MSSKRRIATICAALAVTAAVLWMTMANQRSLTTLTYSQFLENLRNGRIASVTLTDANTGAVPAVCRLTNGNSVGTVLPSNYKEATAAMQENHVAIEIRDSAGPFPTIKKATPFLLLLSIWILLMIFKVTSWPMGKVAR